VKLVITLGVMMHKKRYKNVLATAVIVGLFAGTSQTFAANPDDPYEPFNRVMFRFNDTLDRFVLKPIATLYNKITPKPLAAGLTNFYNNVDTIPTIINDILQGNFKQTTNDVWRFAINTTVGVGGLFDVASRVGLDPNLEDFGLTLAHWGYRKSNYLVLPFIGPSTVRDGIAMPVNYYFMTPYPLIYPQRARYAWYAGGVLVRRADLLRYEGFMQQVAIDKYVFMRDAYMQHRNFLIERNKVPYAEKSKPNDVALDKKETQAEVQTKPFVNI